VPELLAEVGAGNDALRDQLFKALYSELRAMAARKMASERAGHTLLLAGLGASGTPVTDLSALDGMPLTSLRLHDCGAVTDVSPLAACKELNNVTLPPNPTNIESLRALPKLERISFKGDPNHGYRPDKTAAGFWREWDAKKQPSTDAESPGRPRDAGGENRRG
jgi:hypothetical protein